jgi:hypothetical protein
MLPVIVVARLGGGVELLGLLKLVFTLRANERFLLHIRESFPLVVAVFKIEGLKVHGMYPWPNPRPILRRERHRMARLRWPPLHAPHWVPSYRPGGVPEVFFVFSFSFPLPTFLAFPLSRASPPWLAAVVPCHIQGMVMTAFFQLKPPGYAAFLRLKGRIVQTGMGGPFKTLSVTLPN